MSYRRTIVRSLASRNSNGPSFRVYFMKVKTDLHFFKSPVGPYKHWQYDETQKDDEYYCQYTPFMFGFIVLISNWVLLAMQMNCKCTGLNNLFGWLFWNHNTWSKKSFKDDQICICNLCLPTHISRVSTWPDTNLIFLTVTRYYKTLTDLKYIMFLISDTLSIENNYLIHS